MSIVIYLESFYQKYIKKISQPIMLFAGN